MALPGGAPRGYLAARVRAQDPDEGPNGRLSYRIVSGDPPGLFTIRSDTGEVYLGRPLPPSASPGAGPGAEPGALRLVVAVSDGGLPSLSSTVTLSFTVGPEPPPAAPAASPGPGQRSWDTSFTVIAVLAAGCVALLLAIVGIASSCGTGGKPGREGAAAAGGEKANGHPSEESGRAAEPEHFSSIPDFAHQALHPIAIWQGKHFALDKSELAHQTQDRFSGKDSGKGDSDFNDSDSDISGVGLNKRSALSQKHNGLWSCTNECKILGHSDRCWSPSSRGPSIYRSTTTTQHLTSLGKSTSLPRDLLRKDTYYQALLPKTAGLQSVYQKITCDESETTTSVIVPLYHSVGSKSHIPPTNISSINVSSVHSQI